MSKIIFKKIKKHYWHAFRHEKLFEKQPQPHCQTRGFGSVVAVAFQSVFCLEKYQNNIFFLFLTSTHQNDTKI